MEDGDAKVYDCLKADKNANAGMSAPVIVPASLAHPTKPSVGTNIQIKIASTENEISQED